MTKVNKPLSRETHATVDHKGQPRPVIVTIDRTIIELRLKGCPSRSVTIATDRLFREEEMAAARRAAGI